MSELRHDPIRNRWVIIAPERRLRPHELVRPSAGPRPDAGDCPFEPGKESRTPPEILRVPRPDGKGWQVRVVSNKFPALRVEGQIERAGVGPYDSVSGVGAHEVIVESPDHDRELADMEPWEVELILRAWRERLTDLRRDERLRYILLFKNRGLESGASIAHPHSQLIATPMIPTFIVQELAAGRRHYQLKERCLFCDVIRMELELGERIALETPRYVALNPYASSFPFETWILPKNHAHDIAAAPDAELKALATIITDLTRRLRALLDDPPYNMVLHTAPSPHPRPGRPEYWDTLEYDFHWHLELVPRISRIAGFEWGSGFTINPTAPEEAARFLRDADPEGGLDG
jgi:UDPglucose--hexose-1-phosphate uridylyltransferase